MKSKDEIKYSHIDYIIVRVESDNGEPADVCVSSFGSLANARKYAIKDITETMKNIGEVFSKEINGPVNYENYCGNDLWSYENDSLTIYWEIRKIHHRTTSKWEENAPFKWVKEN